MAPRTLLLTGATGFVGGAVRPALLAQGWQVRCLTRDAARARERAPALDWVQGDVSDPESCARALDGCRAALYLVHGIGEGAGYRQAEVEAAGNFSRAAGAAGVERIVYLGGVAPAGNGVRPPPQPPPGRSGAPVRSRPDRRASRQHDRRAREPQLAHRPRSRGPPAGDGPAALAEVTHPAGRHRRRRDRAGAGAGDGAQTTAHGRGALPHPAPVPPCGCAS